MPRRRDPDNRRGGDEQERGKARDEEREGRHEPPHPEGRERRVFEEQMEKRLGGGAPPSPEAYARALEQWNRLPGAITKGPTNVIPPTPESLDDTQQDRTVEEEERS